MSKGKSVISKILLTILGLILIVVGVATFVTDSSYLVGGKTEGEVNEMLFNNEDLSDYEDKYLSIDIYGNLGKFAETNHTVNLIPTGTDNHYVVWLDDGSFMAVTAPKKMSSQFDAQEEEVWAYINYETEDFPETPIRLAGKMERLTGELYSYYDEALQDIGVTPAEYEVRYYTISGAESRWMALLVPILCTLIGLVMLLSALGGFFFGKGKKNSPAMANGNYGITGQQGMNQQGMNQQSMAPQGMTTQALQTPTFTYDGYQGGWNQTANAANANSASATNPEWQQTAQAEANSQWQQASQAATNPEWQQTDYSNPFDGQ